jgi:hypothetical protein
MIFVVRDDASTSRIFVQASDTTWQAYNAYGGNSLYVGSPAGRAYKVSYNRPFTTRGDAGGQDWVFNAEYPMIRFLESNGYDVSYTTGTDSDRRGALIKQHQTFLSVGHDEYWSGGQRTNVEAARAAGVNLAFFSGNEVFWKTRWENSIAGPSTANRTLVTYKETHANAKIDPTPAWTGTWRDPRFSPPADGGRPENALTGESFFVNAGTTSIQVPSAEGKQPFWRNTTVANLAPGQVATLPAGTLGYEWDVDVNNGNRPAGLVHLSSTTVDVPSLLLDYGSTYGTGTATHSLTLYRASSGALVFGAGTIQWSWGLDANHDRGNDPADLRMQQATVNLFADMGAQPGSPQAGLVIETPTSTTTTTTAPTTTSSTVPSVVLGAVARSGYWMVGTDGIVYPFGDAKDLGNPSALLGGVPAMDIEPTPSLNGYWVVDSAGRVFSYGDAVSRGNANRAALVSGETITSLSRTKSGNGYWLFTTRGRAIPFGDATFLGDMSTVKLNGPVQGSVATPTGLGYYMVASDGGIFSFGDAAFHGSMGATKLNAPVRSMVPTPDGLGYWLVAGDGGIFAFTAPFRGSMGSTPLNKPVVGMVANGNGYLMVAADGGIFNFSDRPFAGSLGNNPPTHPITAVATLN